jgi:hypothetical protein
MEEVQPLVGDEVLVGVTRMLTHGDGSPTPLSICLSDGCLVADVANALTLVSKTPLADEKNNLTYIIIRIFFPSRSSR